MITKPMLPPRKGYIEAVDANGRHYYKALPETLEKERQVAQADDADALAIDHEYRLTLLELGIEEV